MEPADGQSGTSTWLQQQAGWISAWLVNIGLIGDGAAKAKIAAAPGQPAPPVVTTSRPLKRETVEWDEYTGRFEPVEMVEVRARVSGYLTGVHFKDGQKVKIGDLLYSIDPRPFERSLATAQAELEQARTRVENAAKDVDRGRPLVEKRILSEKVFDDRENLVRDAEAAVKVAEAKVKSAELELSFTRISAPIAGLIGRSTVTGGNYVSAGGTNGATLLTTIVQQDPIFVYFDVGENNTLKYKRLAQAGQRAGATVAGAPLQVALPDETGFPHEGRLDFSDNRLDPGTGTLRARGLLANGSGLFSPGMFARVRVAGSGRYPALFLPDEAIGTDQSNKYVYVIGDDDVAQRRVVQLGPVVEGLRIIRQGLTAQDWVIVKGIQRARPGQKVAPRREQLQVSAAPMIDIKALEQ